MTAQIVPPTPSMQARAADLLSHADRWSRGTSRQTGEPFVLFSGSKGSVYVTSPKGCSCPSYLHRGACSHHVAVARFEQDRPADVGHDDLATECDVELEIMLADAACCRRCGMRATGRSGYCRECADRLWNRMFPDTND